MYVLTLTNFLFFSVCRWGARLFDGGGFRHFNSEFFFVLAAIVPFIIGSWELGVWIATYLFLGYLGWRLLPSHWGYVTLPLGWVFENFGVEHRLAMMNLSMGVAALWLTKSKLNFQNAFPLRLFMGSVWTPTEHIQTVGHSIWPWMNRVWMISLGLLEVSLATATATLFASSIEVVSLASPADSILMLMAVSIWFFLGLDGAYRVVRGLTACYGFRVPSNFDRPWLSLDVADHWRRWHVPVMNWFNYFVYTPLRIKFRKTPLVHEGLTLLIFIAVGQLIRFGWGSLVWGVLNSALVLLTPKIFASFRARVSKVPIVGRALGVSFCIALTAVIEVLTKPMVAMDLDLYIALVDRALDFWGSGLGVSSIWDDVLFVSAFGITVFMIGERMHRYFERSRAIDESHVIFEFLLAFSIPIIIMIGLIVVKPAGIPYVGGN